MCTVKSLNRLAAAVAAPAAARRLALAVLPALLVIATAPGGARAANYQSVLADKSRIGFSFKQMGVTMDGRFRKFSAQVLFDTDKPTQARGRVDIDLNSVDAGSSEADQEVLGKSWFHVAAHPKASFLLEGMKPVGSGQYEAAGRLTLKGQTRELRVPLKLSPQGVLTGSFVLRRADFGIGEGMWTKFDIVANEVTVHLALELK
jgi:polyisoprenoid-binding protein YceI